MPDESEDEAKGERRTDEPREAGEILARSPNVFSSYRNLPEETEKVLTEY